MYDIHNEARSIKGSFTHTFTHSSGAEFLMKHEAGVVQVALDIIKKMEVDLVVELGTLQGGFTKLVEDALPNVEIHTFDHENMTQGVREFFGPKVTFHVENIIFNTANVAGLLERPERKLLYCDNGCKRREVAMYSQFLNIGDYIGVHDWGNEIVWNDVKDHIGTWDRFMWCEVEEVGQTTRFWRKNA